MTGPRRSRVVFARCVAVLVALVVGELATQVVFRIRYGESPRSFGAKAFQRVERYMSDHPYLPYIATKGRAYINRDMWGDVVEVEFNSLGDRGPEPEDPKRRTRLIAFGGSTTFGARSALHETWPGQLESRLGPDRYEVVNAAQNGATSADTLVNLALIHIDLDPDYVLVYHGTNDLESSYARGFKSDYSHRRRKIGDVPPVFEALPRWLDHSAVFVLTRNAILGNRAYADLWSRYTRKGGYDLEAGPFGLETFRRNLVNIVAVARARGARVVLGTFQYRKAWAEEHISPEFADAWERGIDAQNAIIRDLARTGEDVYLAEVAGSFEPTPEELYDFCHLTVEGNARIAAAFLEAVTRAEARSPES